MTHRVRLLIRGRVQHVGFRYFTMLRARALGVTGRVWNRPDGSVEVEAEGPRAALAGLMDVLREGPPGARVTGIDDEWSEGEARHRTFEVAR